jgi:hypothetical protein
MVRGREQQGPRRVGHGAGDGAAQGGHGVGAMTHGCGAREAGVSVVLEFGLFIQPIWQLLERHRFNRKVKVVWRDRWVVGFISPWLSR